MFSLTDWFIIDRIQRWLDEGQFFINFTSAAIFPKWSKLVVHCWLLVVGFGLQRSREQIVSEHKTVIISSCLFSRRFPCVSLVFLNTKIPFLPHQKKTQLLSIAVFICSSFKTFDFLKKTRHYPVECPN